MAEETGIQIEDLAPRHEASLVELFNALKEHGDESTFYPHPLTADEAARLCRHAGLDQYFVATVKGKVVGYGMLRGWDEGYRTPSAGFATHPRYRQKKIFSTVVRSLIRQARNRGATEVRMTCSAHHELLIRSCSRLGFIFTPHSPGRLLGMIDLKQDKPGDRLRVGLCADLLISWAGGIDLIVNQFRAMKATEPGNRICLLAPGAAPSSPKSRWKTFRYALKGVVRALIRRPPLKQSSDDIQALRLAELVGRMREIDSKLVVRYASGLDDGLAATAAALQLDAVCFAMRLPKPRPACALIGYVPDYQHRHMPHLFPAKELTERDKMFGQLIASSNAMVMSSQAATDDMRRFTPEPVPRLHVIPFSPTLNPEWLQDRPERVKAYAIDGPYFIVCNQSWMHKDHLTVFRALAEITRPWPNVSLVCTGDTTDYRDPTYFGQLEAEATKLALGSRLRFLGHIPKRDQIELLKHAVALIQPTLFEGGPGGGATCEAVALGQRVLITDLPVNQEIDSGDLRFFAPGDHRGLAKLMGNVLDEVPTRRNDPALLARTNARMHRAGESIWSAIRSAIDEHRNYLLKRPYEKE